MVSASAVDNTEVFQVKVTSPDPVEVELIANTIAHVLPDRISDIVHGCSVCVVDYAVVPNAKISPNVTKITMIGIVVGALLACALIALATIMDDLIHDTDTLKELYDLPVLAAIPDLMTARSGDYSNHYSQYGKYGYGYRQHGSAQKESEAE